MGKMPGQPVLRWAADAIGTGAEVVGVHPLNEHQGPQSTWLLRVEDGTATVEAVLKTGPLSWSAGFTGEAAGMEFATKHNLPAPCLLAAELDGRFGVLAILSTALPGNTWRIWEEPPSTTRLRALGGAAAQLHAISLSPRPELPLRIHHIPHDDYTAERQWAARYQAAPDSEKETVFHDLLDLTGWPSRALRKVVTTVRTTPLLQAAEERISQLPVPGGDTVFVHADLHAGNILWDGDSLVGIVDWDSAGAGHPGVDLGSLRLDAALHYDIAAAEEVTNGWQEASGQDAGHIAYFDVVSALQTAADIGRQTVRRDAFLRRALDALDRT
jgi:Ser/Thr protein kinase RdoA (MazF antagonist)